MFGDDRDDFNEYSDEYFEDEFQATANPDDEDLSCIISNAAHEEIDTWVKRVNESANSEECGEDISFHAAESMLSVHEYVTLKKWEVNDRLTHYIFHVLDDAARKTLLLITKPDLKVKEDEEPIIHGISSKDAIKKDEEVLELPF